MKWKVEILFVHLTCNQNDLLFSHILYKKKSTCALCDCSCVMYVYMLVKVHVHLLSAFALGEICAKDMDLSACALFESTRALRMALKAAKTCTKPVRCEVFLF